MCVRVCVCIYNILYIHVKSEPTGKDPDAGKD